MLNNLGVFYTNERRFTEAEEMHQRALAIRKEARGDGHADIAQSMQSGGVYHSRGDYARAVELYRRPSSYGSDERRAGGDYEIAASNYADLLRSLGKGRKAAAVVAQRAKAGAFVEAALAPGRALLHLHFHFTYTLPLPELCRCK